MKEARLGLQGKAYGPNRVSSLRSMALKSTPELDTLLASDKEITIVFHSASSAELLADGKSHSTITLSESDLIEAYKAPTLDIYQHDSLQFHSTSNKRMTIMTSADNQMAVVSRVSVAPRSRREASHLDHAELASKLTTTEGLQMEKERKRKTTDDYNKLKKKSKKRKKESVSRLVKVSPVPIGASAADLRTFFGGLGLSFFFVSFMEIERDNGTITLYAECSTLHVAGLAAKRSGEKLRIKTNTQGKDKNKDKREVIVSTSTVTVQAVSNADAVWVRGTAVRVLPSYTGSWREAMSEVAPTIGQLGEQPSSPSSIRSPLSIATILSDSVETLTARSTTLGLALPSAESIIFPAMDGLPREAVLVPSFHGEFDHRHLMRTLSIANSTGAIVTILGPKGRSGLSADSLVDTLKGDLNRLEWHRMAEQSLLLLGNSKSGGMHCVESAWGPGMGRLDLLSRLSALYSRLFSGAMGLRGKY